MKTKKALSVINDWKRSTDSSLYDVYGRFSDKKAKAFEYCKELCHKMNGTNLKILSHNSFIFTAAFQFVDSETGVIRIMHITPSADKAYDL